MRTQSADTASAAIPSRLPAEAVDSANRHTAPSLMRGEQRTNFYLDLLLPVLPSYERRLDILRTAQRSDLALLPTIQALEKGHLESPYQLKDGGS